MKRGGTASRRWAETIRRIGIWTTGTVTTWSVNKQLTCSNLSIGVVSWGGRSNFPETAAHRGTWRCPDRRPSSCTTSPRVALSSHWVGKIRSKTPPISHQRGAFSGIFGCPVGRSEDLRRRIAHRQYPHGFQRPAKFTYMHLSEVEGASKPQNGHGENSSGQIRLWTQVG